MGWHLVKILPFLPKVHSPQPIELSPLSCVFFIDVLAALAVFYDFTPAAWWMVSVSSVSSPAQCPCSSSRIRTSLAMQLCPSNVPGAIFILAHPFAMYLYRFIPLPWPGLGLGVGLGILRRRIISVMTNDINGTHLPVPRVPLRPVVLMSCRKSLCTPLQCSKFPWTNSSPLTFVIIN